MRLPRRVPRVAWDCRGWPPARPELMLRATVITQPGAPINRAVVAANRGELDALAWSYYFVFSDRDAIATRGGIGYTWEYGLNIWFRRSVFDRAVLGSPSVHRERAATLAGW